MIYMMKKGETVYTVKDNSVLDINFLFIISMVNIFWYDQRRNINVFYHCFYFYMKNDEYIGKNYKEFTFFKPKFILDYKDWQIEGNFWEWDYQIVDYSGNIIGLINKETFMSDTYSLTIEHDEDAFMF